jgi:hypothetical protein
MVGLIGNGKCSMNLRINLKRLGLIVLTFLLLGLTSSTRADPAVGRPKPLRRSGCFPIYITWQRV